MPTVYRSRLPIAFLTTLVLAAWSGPSLAADLEAGRQTFESVCAACHGTTGRPDPDNPVVQALDPEPADLSDPLFNSREPASDWHVVVTHGGPALGLSAAMPAQGEVLSEKQIEDVVAYAKTLADTSGYPPGELNFFLPIRTKKAYPEDEIVWKSRYSDQPGRDVWRNVLEIEKRFGKR
jgi:mono/diheme cytochrome c family protein